MPRQVEDEGGETPAQIRAREIREAKAEAAAEKKKQATTGTGNGTVIHSTDTSSTSSSVPAAPTTGDSYGNAFFDSLGAGEALGNDLFAPGSLGRLTDPKAAETAALLERLKGNLGGMDEATQNAARENALLQINSDANNQLGQITNAAAGRGLRGGVVAGAQQPVLGAAASAYSGALRDLAGRVSQSQQDASTMYNGALNNAADIDTGIQTSNNLSADSEFAGRLKTPFDYANAMTTYKAGDAADKLAQQAAAIDLLGPESTKKSRGSGVKSPISSDTVGIPSSSNNGFAAPLKYDREGRRINDAGELVDIFGNVTGEGHVNAAGSSKSKPTPIRTSR